SDFTAVNNPVDLQSIGHDWQRSIGVNAKLGEAFGKVIGRLRGRDCIFHPLVRLPGALRAFAYADRASAGADHKNALELVGRDDMAAPVAGRCLARLRDAVADFLARGLECQLAVSLEQGD